MPDSEVSQFYKPLRHRSKFAFGHLCIDDIIGCIARSRARIRYDFKKNSIEEDLLGLDYEALQYRYFLCGEYGPNTFRPHYHALLFFPSKLSDRVHSYVQKNLAKVWMYGALDVQIVQSDGIKQYLSEYVTGFIGLPEVLRTKSLRPFCTFSKAPAIGAFDFDKDKVFSQLCTGIVEQTKFDPHTAEFRTSSPPRSYFSKFFPKCKGFSTGHYFEKLRVYSYVYRLFKAQGVTHSVDEVLKLKVSDIPFELYDPSLRKEVYVNGRCIASSTIPLASYTDRYCSLVCYRYCVLYNLNPATIIDCIERIYSKKALDALGDFYRSLELSDIDTVKYSILHDRDFVNTLPTDPDSLEDWQYYTLESYGFDVSELYGNGYLDPSFIDTYDICNDPLYSQHVDRFSSMTLKGVKRKKIKEFRNNVISSRLFNRVSVGNGYSYR